MSLFHASSTSTSTRAEMVIGISCDGVRYRTRPAEIDLYTVVGAAQWRVRRVPHAYRELLRRRFGEHCGPCLRVQHEALCLGQLSRLRLRTSRCACTTARIPTVPTPREVFTLVTSCVCTVHGALVTTSVAYRAMTSATSSGSRPVGPGRRLAISRK